MLSKGLVKNIIESGTTFTEQLLDIVSDYDIYCELLGVDDIDVGQMIESPLRGDDNNPSFNLYAPTKIDDARPDELWWMDISRGWFGDVFSFIKEFAEFEYGKELDTRKEIVKFVDSIMDLGIFNSEPVSYKRRKIDMDDARKKAVIHYEPRDFTRRDVHWWARRAVDTPLLTGGGVDSIKTLMDEFLDPYRTFGMYELAFAYKVKDKCKIYQPEADRLIKWRSCVPAGAEYMFGIDNLTRTDYLIITKSNKDILTFKSFIWCDVIAPQAESVAWDIDLIKELELRYNKVYIVMDYDPAGIKAANDLKAIAPSFEIVWVSTKKEYDDDSEEMKVLDKDISDLTINKGFQAAYNRMRTMFPLIVSKNFRPDRVQYFKDLVYELENDY